MSANGLVDVAEKTGISFPPDLALRIVRKAARLAEEFEEKALSQLKRDAERALAIGARPSDIIREMGL